MNMLQCELCVQQQPGTQEAAASLVKASEAVEKLRIVYVFCNDCNQHLCKACDYKVHVLPFIVESDEDELDEAEHQKHLSQDGQPKIYQAKIKTAATEHQSTTSTSERQMSGAAVADKEQASEKQHQETIGRQRKPSPDDNIDSFNNRSEDHSRVQVCEECVEKQCRLSNLYCPKCEQALCEDCWLRIHNKGARLRHPRRSLQKPKFFTLNHSRKTSLTNQQSATSSSQQDSSLSHSNPIQSFDDALLRNRASYDDKDRQSHLPGSLQVQLAQSNFSAHPLPHMGHSIQGHHPQEPGQRKPDLQYAPMGNQKVMKPQLEYGHQVVAGQHFIHPHYGQAPTYIPATNHQQQIYQQAHGGGHGHGHMPIEAEPFIPGDMHMLPQGSHSFQGQYYISRGHQPQIEFGQSPRQPVMVPPQHHMQSYTSAVYPAQMVYQPKMRQESTTEKEKSAYSQSEDDYSSTSIHDEARVRMPTTFIEFDKKPPHHAAYRHGNLNSEPRNGERVNQNNSNSIYSAHLETNAEQIKATDAATTTTEQPQATKSFTPLRKQMQSTSEYMPSPLMRTPNEQQRLREFKNSSKLLTPPLTMGGQNRANLKTKFAVGASAQQYVSKQRPLKIPKDRGVQGGSYQAKPPKGPYIDSQVKTGKPNSLSSHGMDSDFSGDNQSSSYNHQDQKSLDAYQLGHQSSYSAKNNLRKSRKAPAHLLSREARDASQDSYGQKSQNSGGTNSRRGGLKGTNSYNERQRAANSSSTGLNNDSRCVVQKAGSFSYNKSGGSGGNQSGSGNNYVAKSGSNSRMRPQRGDSEGSILLQPVPVIQPVVQLEGKKQRHRLDRFEEENKAIENELIRKMQLILFENAATGDLLNLKSKFTAQMTEKILIQEQQAHQLIEKAVKVGIIHQTDRNFANAQKIEFISLKIQVMSHQCLQWVITSLRRDEMTPTESAIKNRTKEAFDFKLSNDQWDSIMTSIKPPVGEGRTQTINAAKSSYGSITAPDKGSSALTMVTQPRNQAARADSSNTLSSTESTQLVSGGGGGVGTTTTTTVSAQGFTRIVRQSGVNEADTGSGSTAQLNNASGSAGEAVGSGEATGSGDSLQTNRDQNNNTMSQEEGITTARQSGSFTSNELQSLPKFKVVRLPSESESVQGVTPEIFAIYMEDEEVWTGVDIEDDTTVDRSLYQIMKEFLKDYFCAEEQSSSDQQQQCEKSYDDGFEITPPLTSLKKASSDEYNSELRMIPGGRYGCTQFLKICGPEPIRKCSVGKTTQMVQLAIKEDVLRHLKTQIVWSTQVDKHKTEQDTMEDSTILVQRKAKLEKVKDAIVEILAESKTGMSLAQLPQYLKKKLPFNLEWNELGFPKLKDLLQSMTDQIKVELRDVNHPFAYLMHKQRNHQSQHDNQMRAMMKPMLRQGNLSEQMEDGTTRQMVYCDEKLSQIVGAVFTLLQMEPQGIYETEFKRRIQDTIGFEFSFQELGCNSEYEFIKRYVMPKDDSIEFLTIKNQGTFNIRSHKILSNYLVNQIAPEERMQVLQQASKNEAKQQQKYNAVSHQDYAHGPLFCSQSGTFEPTNISRDYNNNQNHQQRIQTHPDEVRANASQLNYKREDYIPTYESIYGGCDSQSDMSSLRNHVSELSLDLQKQSSQNTTQKKTIDKNGNWQNQQQQQQQQQQIQPSFNPWYQQLYPGGGTATQHDDQQMQSQAQAQAQAQQMMQNPGFNHGMFNLDHVKINQKLYGMSPHQNATAPYYSMPIDQMDQQEADENQRGTHLPQQQPHSMNRMIFNQHHNYHVGDVESPRMHQSISHLLEDSPSQNYAHHQESAEVHMAKQKPDSENDPYNLTSEGTLNQSIFSDNFIQNRRLLQGPQAHKHYSFDLKAASESRPDNQSDQDQYSALLKQDDLGSVKSEAPVTRDSIKLDITVSKRKSKAKILEPDTEQRRITEETDGSHQSTPELIDTQVKGKLGEAAQK